ncbi:MAG: hypothetical protein RR277_08520 [Rikenellaceae bacterium]
MMRITVLERETNRVFTKVFCSPYLAEQWAKKVKHSKKLVVIGVSSESAIFDEVV